MKKSLPYILLILILLVAGGFYLDRTKDGSDTSLPLFKNNSMDDVKLENYGVAPEFTGIANWLNSDPLTMQQLRGKVVLIDFWTYSCINCIRTLPYVTGWYEKYKDKGFVVVGVHTPEFAFEKDTSNVQAAFKRHGINYPVAQDNDYGTWQAYSNRYWPAHYLIDQSGKIVYTHFGEGKYQETEQAIQQLIGIGDENEMAEENAAGAVSSGGGSASGGKTPEIYFGLKRLDLLSKSQEPSRANQQYHFPSDLPLNYFALEGQWIFNDEGVKLVGTSGKIRLNFYSKDVHIVAKGDNEIIVKVLIDGKLLTTIKIQDSSLYTLSEGTDSKQRILELQIEGTGLEVFTFTFG